MVATTRRSVLRVKGDQWVFPIHYEDPEGTSFDFTGSSVTARITYSGGALEIDEEIGGAEDATGIRWTDREGGRFEVRVNEADSDTIPPSRFAKLVIQHLDSNGDRFTLAILPIEVIAA